MALKIIGAGYGRTGTSSLKIALEMLGYGKCYHMVEVFKNRHFGSWGNKADGSDISWDEIFEGYQSTLDWPSTAYYKELAEYYPDAQVILTIRDPDNWYRSITTTIYQASKNMPRWIPGIRGAAMAIDKIVWNGEFQGRILEKEYAINRFNQHTEQVINSIPAERLLVYQASEGWEPLCSFLGVPVPKDVPFPRVNSSKSVGRGVFMMKLLSRLPYLVALLLGVYFLSRVV